MKVSGAGGEFEGNSRFLDCQLHEMIMNIMKKSSLESGSRCK